MFFNNISIYSIPFIGIILIIIILSLSNTRDMLTYQLNPKRKKRLSINNDINESQNPYMTIQMNPFSNLDANKYIPRITTILLEDDEELMKSDISASNFCENKSIELRLKQDLDYDNDADDD